MPMTAQAKRYARRGGLAAVRPGVGQKAWVKMTADLVNQGKVSGFPSQDAGETTAGVSLESTARALVQALISRG